MKNLFLILFFGLTSVTFGQLKGDVKLDWIDKKEMFYGDRTVLIPSLKNVGFVYHADEQSISLTHALNVSDIGILSKIEINGIDYESVSQEDLGDLSLASIPSKLDVSLQLTTSRGMNAAFINFSPIVKDAFGYKKVKSFSYQVIDGGMSSVGNARIRSTQSNSVLASGDWYRFYIEKSGVYRITRSFLQQLGVDVARIDPRKIKIYGNGGRMLPLSNAVAYPIDLTENAIQVIGEEDGVFNNDDFILFYGEGIFNWNEESRTHQNLYDSKSYYYINVQGDNGKRVATLQQPAETASVNVSLFDDYQFHELDLVNIGRLGRQWFGETFDVKQEQEFDFVFPNIDLATPIKLLVNAASASFTTTSFDITSNGIAASTLSFPALNASSDVAFFSASLPSNIQVSAAETIKIKLKYNNNGVPGSRGFLDHIRLVAKRRLQGYGKQFLFQYDQAATSSGVANYAFANASQISQVWDVTDIYNVSSVSNTGQSNFNFKAPLGEVRKYVAIDPSDYYAPLRDNSSKVLNQNLKGTLLKNAQGEFVDLDYVIIAPNFLSLEAERLASFHRSNSNLTVKVVPLEQIYHEFGSGKQDIAAIRNCVKYIYENASAPSKRLRYINLFGDASFDYKNRIPNNSNIVPIYHSLDSNTSGESSYASDDFYGLMDANEGNIVSRFGGIDIAVGRMLVNDSKQASEMVTKVLEYHDPASYGSWRNNFVLISDDSDVTSDANLQNKQNNLANTIAGEKPFFNVSKILLDSYTQEASAGGSRYPKARADFFNAFEKGALVFNYLGHGGEDGLSAERIWEKSDGQNLSNRFKYPLFITITCDFSRFDNPFRPTAGEFTYWNPAGGAIAMITTIRSIGQFSAETFNDTFSRNLLSFGSNQYTSIAEALRVSKNSNPTSATNVVFYIGDPALMLAIPRPKINLTKVNDVPVSDVLPDLKSLSKVKLSGEVTDENNNPIANYNGQLSTAVFDKMLSRSTFNNDGNSPPINFNVLGETIFRGNVTITNGKFEFSFVVPRDIRVPLGDGRISFYAKRDQVLQNEAGFDTSIKVGGINENAVADNISPRVKLYMNDETFVSGGTTNSSPFLVAFLEDENGINTASGIGHDIIAVLDGDTNNPFVLNDYYQANVDDFTTGSLRFPLRNLEPGLHTISFTAWDVYNNPVTTEIQFVVVGDETVTLSRVLNYPNPFVSYTEFWFTHNRPFEPLEVQVQVMTVTGKVVWTKNQLVTTSGFLSKEISWDGRDDFGDRLGKGVYVYKLTVKSTLTNKKTEKIEKLVIL